MVEMISLTISFVSLILSIIVAVINYFMSKEKAKIEKEWNIENHTPRLYPVESIFTKNQWVRWYYGTQGYGEQTPVPVILYDRLNIDEKRMFDYTKDRAMQKVFFWMIEGKWHLIFNMCSGKPNCLFENHNCELVLKNFGADLCKIAINKAQVVFLDGKVIELEGIAGDICTEYIPHGGSFTIVIDEMYDDVDNSTCMLGASLYDELKDGLDILKTNMLIGLTYEEYIVNISLWNTQYDEFIYDIIVKRENSMFRTHVELKGYKKFENVKNKV